MPNRGQVHLREQRVPLHSLEAESLLYCFQLHVFQLVQAHYLQEVQQLLSVLNDDPIRPAVILAVMYGLRRSEAVGLRWKDIDFKNKTMTICNTVTRMATVHELEETKNESSHRTLPLIPGTEEYLQSLRREQKETMLLCGNRFDDSCHVCTWPDGRSLQPDYVSQHFNQVLQKNNFRVIRYHSLRHPYVKHTTKNIILKSRKPKLSENRPDNLGYLLL